jgi:adenosylcobinamide-GDP ribazoletransferase
LVSLLVAAQFLTRIPMPIHREVDGASLGRSMRWFPLVGIGIGALVGLIDWTLAPVIALPVRAALIIVVLIGVTGALHLDGLMDTCDALFAFTSPERRLEIMHDSRVGSFAIAGAATMLLLKYAAIVALPVGSSLFAFVAAGATSRWAMVYATVSFPSARASGLGHTFKELVGPVELICATGLALVGAATAGIAGLAALVAVWLFAMAAARYTMSKIPGLTGDNYGAICEGAETLVLLLLPPLWRFLPAALPWYS